jgi:ketosteroid isomerase-like protein
MRALLLAAAAACAHLDPEAARRSLLAADTRFAQDVAERGVDAWVDAFGDEGVMLPGGGALVRGRQQIRTVMAALGDPRTGAPELRLRWRPLGAQVSGDGTLGWTWGNALAFSPRGESKSKYLTVWRRAADGAWKVAADQGSPGWADPASPP